MNRSAGKGNYSTETYTSKRGINNRGRSLINRCALRQTLIVRPVPVDHFHSFSPLFFPL